MRSKRREWNYEQTVDPSTALLAIKLREASLRMALYAQDGIFYKDQFFTLHRYVHTA
jgi:hypothetical protein